MSSKIVKRTADEPEAAPALPAARPVNVLGPDDPFSDALIDRIRVLIAVARGRI